MTDFKMNRSQMEAFKIPRVSIQGIIKQLKNVTKQYAIFGNNMVPIAKRYYMSIKLYTSKKSEKRKV